MSGLCIDGGEQEAVGDAAVVRDQVDEVFDRSLLQHPNLELQWLQLAFATRESQVRFMPSTFKSLGKFPHDCT